jgi:hypothetical protein
MTEEEKILGRIRDSFREHRLIPFVGAGISMCVPDFPSWNDLLAALSVKLPEEARKHFEKLNHDPLERAEFFTRSLGLEGLRELRTEVCGILQNGHKNLTNTKLANKAKYEDYLACQLLLAQNFHRVYTTNYDRLIEEACQEVGYTPFSIYSANYARSPEAKPLLNSWCDQHPVCGPRSSMPSTKSIVQIVKYHGDYLETETSESKSIIITEEDYYRRLIDLNTMDVLLMRDLVFYDILFLGYSFRDMSLKYVFHQITRLLEEVDRDYPQNHRDGLFFITTENKPERSAYLKAAYRVETIYIQDCVRQESDDTSSGKKLIFDFKERPHISADSMTLNSFNALYELAENEPYVIAKKRAFDPKSLDDDENTLWMNFKDSIIKQMNVTSLSSDQIMLIEELAMEQAFSQLRPAVMRACFSGFLEKVVA